MLEQWKQYKPAVADLHSPSVGVDNNTGADFGDASDHWVDVVNIALGKVVNCKVMMQGLKIVNGHTVASIKGAYIKWNVGENRAIFICKCIK